MVEGHDVGRALQWALLRKRFEQGFGVGQPVLRQGDDEVGVEPEGGRGQALARGQDPGQPRNGGIVEADVAFAALGDVLDALAERAAHPEVECLRPRAIRREAVVVDGIHEGREALRDFAARQTRDAGAPPDGRGPAGKAPGIRRANRP